MDRELAPHQGSALTLHLEKCPFCAEFKSQVEVLRKACGMFVPLGGQAENQGAALPEDARERIKRRLKSRL